MKKTPVILGERGVILKILEKKKKRIVVGILIFF